ncbi:hypothetical protein ABTX80_22495 [Streptomyces erythrochromogenes]|uniref:hypothetical protein n=1 Tax=Streptomyces erythrochromogenes TaxID=285574 RepID=UPI003318B77A
MGSPPEPLERPAGYDDIVVELPLPLSEQNPPELPDPPAEPEPEPGGEATIAT